MFLAAFLLRTTGVTVLGCATALCLGCTGQITEGETAISPGAGGGGADRQAGSGGAGGNAGAAAAQTILPMRLLTRVEYNHTVADLLGDTSLPANTFPSESAGDTGFALVQKLDEVNVGAYLKAAEDVAARAASDTKKLLGCDPAGVPDCVASFIATFGRRAYRRPLTTDERDQHFAFYRDTLRGTLQLPEAEAVVALLTAMLQSPHFLYRWENAWAASRDGASVRLNPHHLAAQLSYFLWASMPDAELFSAADANALQTREQIEAQARRLLQHERAMRTVAAFTEQWMGITTLPGALRGKAGWGPALANAMVAEVNRYASEVILRGDGRLETLFTSPATRVDGTLAAFYGNTAITGSALQQLSFPAGQRAGIVTLAGVMAAHATESESSPILRGKFVREHLLCEPIPPPPGDIPELAAPDPNVPKKERFAMHAQQSCASCHDLMDPLGFAYEHYDHTGAHRTVDGKFPIDSTGEALGLDGADRPFANGVELGAILARSNSARECAARQWFRYGLARKESPADSAAIEGALAAFRAADFDMREWLVALATSRAFTHRSLATGEVLP